MAKGKTIANAKLKDVTQYRSVGVTELRDKLRDFVELDNDGPVIVYRRSEPRKVLVDYDTWIQILRNTDVSGGELVKDDLTIENIARALKRVLK